jgi:hypothetical protein
MTWQKGGRYLALSIGSETLVYSLMAAAESKRCIPCCSGALTSYSNLKIHDYVVKNIWWKAEFDVL